MWMHGRKPALGIGIGLAVAFHRGSFAVGAQMIGLQAGYSFASTFDPDTQADSRCWWSSRRLAAGLLFFATGLDREVLRIFARSLETVSRRARSCLRAAPRRRSFWPGFDHVHHRPAAGAAGGRGDGDGGYFAGAAGPRQCATAAATIAFPGKMLVAPAAARLAGAVLSPRCCRGEQRRSALRRMHGLICALRSHGGQQIKRPNNPPSGA